MVEFYVDKMQIESKLAVGDPVSLNTEGKVVSVDWGKIEYPKPKEYMLAKDILEVFDDICR